MNNKILDEYGNQLIKIFAEKLKGKTLEEIAQTPIGEVIPKASKDMQQLQETINRILKQDNNQQQTSQPQTIINNKTEISNADKITISYLQRRLVIGYPRAVKVMEELKTLNIVEVQNNENIVLDKQKLQQYIDDNFKL